MNYEELVNQVLKLIDEYSKKGTPLIVNKTADYRLKIPAALNEILMDLAVTTGRIHAEWRIVNNPVLNTYNYDTSSIKGHLPGTDDVLITLTGAKSYFLEVTGEYDVYIEEYITDTWTEIENLTPTTAVSTFTELKGNITATDATNSIRIRLSGDYPYSYRNYILYPYPFESDNQVQQNRAWFEYAFPDDWLEFNNAMIQRDTRQWLPYAEYRLTPTHFCFNRYNLGEIIVNYFRKPAFVEVDNPIEPTAEELAQTIDAAQDALFIVPDGVAGKVLAVDNPANSAELLNYYENRKFTLLGNDGQYGLASYQELLEW